MGLRSFFDRIEPNFEKGGKLEAFFPVYEAIDTALYTPGYVTHRASHARDGLDLICEVPINVAQALLGSRIRAPALLLSGRRPAHEERRTVGLPLGGVHRASHRRGDERHEEEEDGAEQERGEEAIVESGKDGSHGWKGEAAPWRGGHSPFM